MPTVDLKTLLGMAIKMQRASLSLSQEELAYRAGLHRTYVSDLERGARNPSIESIEKLAGALQISVSKLFESIGSGAGARGIVEILLVENDPQDIELTIRTFGKAQITNPVHIARDGQEALDFIFANVHREDLPSTLLVLLDLNLPKMSGLEVLQRIKADQRTRDIPIIILTVSSRDREIAECRRLGVQGYIVKPLGFENFSQITPQLSLAWTLVRNRES